MLEGLHLFLSGWMGKDAEDIGQRPRCNAELGDWKRETWHRETIEIMEADIARLVSLCE